MSRTIRFGLYGCNMYRTRDLVAGAECAAPGVVKITACHDIDPAKACFTAEKYGGRAFDSLDAFLACEEVDVVIISLPAYLHAAAYAHAARAGKAIYLERPIPLPAF
jgi:predicted dehydrogenase